jgi:hypothetical protein
MDEIGEPARPSSSSTPVRRKALLSNPSGHLFELTRPEFTPSDLFHRPVRRVRVWEHHGDRDEGAFAPNPYHVVAQLNNCKSFRKRPRKPFVEFEDEMKTGDARLAVVRRGISLTKPITAEPRTDAITMTPRLFAAVNQILQEMPAQSSGTPPVRQPQRMRLRRLAHASETQELPFQNMMIKALNHAKQGRLRASEAFFEDIIEMEWESSMFFLFLSEGRNVNKPYGHAPRSKQ